MDMVDEERAFDELGGRVVEKKRAVVDQGGEVLRCRS